MKLPQMTEDARLVNLTDLYVLKGGPNWSKRISPALVVPVHEALDLHADMVRLAKEAAEYANALAKRIEAASVAPQRWGLWDKEEGRYISPTFDKSAIAWWSSREEAEGVSSYWRFEARAIPPEEFHRCK